MTNALFAPPALGTVLSLTGLPGGSNKIHDKSPYDNIGTITGATWKVLPSGLWYLSFDGSDDYVDLGTRPSLNPVSGLTVELWAYFASHKDWNYIAHKEIWVANGWGLIGYNNGNVSFNVRNNANSNWNFVVLNPSSTRWHHIVETMDYPNTTLKCYLNGELVDTKTTGTGTIEPANNAGTLYLGGASNGL